MFNNRKPGYNPMLEEPDAYDADGKRTVNSWKLFMEDELASEDDEDEESSEFLDKLGLDEEQLSYAKYQWERSEEEDRRRGL